MHTSLVLLLSFSTTVLLAGCRIVKSDGCEAFRKTPAEVSELERKAAAGDADAAWDLYGFHGMCLGDRNGTDKWLRRAAHLGHPHAQNTLAGRIKEDRADFSGFGASRRAAVKSLLQQAARTEGCACEQLASAYAEGYFGAPDHGRSRRWFQQGADLHHSGCWQSLSKYCRRGLGGPRDDAAAYYWISLEARCVDPRSISGQETWAALEEIATHLSLPALERLWPRLDAYMAQVDAGKVKPYPGPFGGGGISAKLEAEGRRFAQQHEDEHRERLRSRQDGS